MGSNPNSIPGILNRYPKAGLLKTPMLIHKLSRLSAHLGYDIYILRDDLTGFALGGNKTRKLDYLIGDALVNNADTLVTMKASSFSRNAAAAGRAFGYEVHVIIEGDECQQNPGSQGFFKQYDTQLHYISKDKEYPLSDAYNHLVESLKAQGKIVYELHPGGSDPIGALGYVDAFDQIMQYSQCSGVHFDTIIHATGSTGTQAGLILGQLISGYDTQIIGIAVSQKAAVQSKRVYELAFSTAKMLSVEFDESLIKVDDNFIGPGYAIPSEECNKAVKLFASMEGILLDHVYTGKAAAGLINYARNRMYKGKNVLFIHTGGNSDLFY